MEEEGQLSLGQGEAEHKLKELYDRLAQCIRMENTEEENLEMMRGLPICQAYLFGCFPTLGEHEVFSILLRFNKGELAITPEEERISQIRMRLDDQVLSLVVCMILQNALGKLPLAALQERLVYMCGPCNKVDSRFFDDVASGLCLLIRKKGRKSRTKKQTTDFYKTPPQFADAEEDENENDKEEEGDKEKEKSEEASQEDSNSADASWVVLRSLVKYELRDADDKDAIVKILEDILRRQPLTIKTIRQRWHREVGIPFGSCDVGGLLKFLKSYPTVFHVTETSKKRHKDSRVALCSSVTDTPQQQPQQQTQPSHNNPTQQSQSAQGRGGKGKGKGRGGRGKAKGKGRGRGKPKGRGN